MKGKPFLVKEPHNRNARNELKRRSPGKDYKTAYPIAVLGPLIIPWGWLFPRWMLPSDERCKRWNTPKVKDSPLLGPDKVGGATCNVYQYTIDENRMREPKALRKNLSSYCLDVSSNCDCNFLTMLPPELRLKIYGYVLGQDRFRLVTVPWQVIAVPDEEGNVSMSQDLMNPINKNKIKNSPANGISLLMTCPQIYREAVDILYSTNTFIFYDFSTLSSFAKSIPPQRLDAIRCMEIYFSPNWSIGYSHPREHRYDLPSQLNGYWDIVVGMKGLRHLKINLEAYQTIWPGDEELAAYERGRLEPLLKLRGLETFDLKIGYIGLDSVVTCEPHDPELMAELKEVVRRPRDE